ncbi:DUF2513 domain-containing protein [Marinomonas pollencensis]|uniref:Uncharacterized protein DUF2513 n=1 Tax=Marinomonas pollencensis TaxID=491954 RepID=A0A3E0DLC5_9GAMM|nr:DUF2513 domain-containing protein [Marinomonas pollencensis]REG83640.1 uncharacterized protein DUF2513 [Marinomonas pollencensis]
MKRDMDLARKILLAVEEKDDHVIPFVPAIENYDKKQINYHIQLLDQAGLVESKSSSTLADGTKWSIKSLTFSGHDFLDASRNDTIWSKAKESIKSKGLSLTLDLLKMALNDAAMSQFKG